MSMLLCILILKISIFIPIESYEMDTQWVFRMLDKNMYSVVKYLYDIALTGKSTALGNHREPGSSAVSPGGEQAGKCVREH